MFFFFQFYFNYEFWASFWKNSRVDDYLSKTGKSRRQIKVEFSWVCVSLSFKIFEILVIKGRTIAFINDEEYPLLYLWLFWGTYFVPSIMKAHPHARLIIIFVILSYVAH